MPRSLPARAHIAAHNGEVTVEILGYHLIPDDLLTEQEENECVLVYLDENGRRRKDIFNCDNVEHLDALAHAQSDEKVIATLVSDSAGDSDSHPEVKEAHLDGLKQKND